MLEELDEIIFEIFKRCPRLKDFTDQIFPPVALERANTFFSGAGKRQSWRGGKADAEPLCELHRRNRLTMILEAAKHLNINLSQCTAVVQGFGNVGSVAVKELANIGVKVIGVSDRTGGFVDEKGLPVEKLLELADKNHSLEGCPYGDKISNEELLELKCDVLVPAALEMQITKANAAKIHCRILAEGANGPTTPDADTILRENGIFLIPDILANAGGVVVSYFEWVQDLQNFFWNEVEVNSKLREILVKSFHAIKDVHPRVT